MDWPLEKGKLDGCGRPLTSLGVRGEGFPLLYEDGRLLMRSYG